LTAGVADQDHVLGALDVGALGELGDLGGGDGGRLLELEVAEPLDLRKWASMTRR
jgi:hypothetical protein